MDTEKFAKIKAGLPIFFLSLLFPQDKGLLRFLDEGFIYAEKTKLILDAGSGINQYKRFFKNKRYISVDIKSNISHPVDVIGDLLIAPIKENCCGFAICTQVLEHVPEPKRLLLELYRVLEPGGTLLLSAPQGWGEHLKPNDYFRFTSFGLRYIFSQTKFEIISIKPLCGFFAYIGNRLQYLPFILFSRLKYRIFVLLSMPIKIVLVIIFSILLPILFSMLDFLDKDRDFTLNYGCILRKPKDAANYG